MKSPGKRVMFVFCIYALALITTLYVNKLQVVGTQQTTSCDVKKPDICALFRRTRLSNIPFKPDLNLNIYPSRDGSKKFILCSYPKTGCTQWIMLLNYLWKGDKQTKGEHLWYGRQNNTLRISSPEYNDTNVPRILIMRNPYMRTVSSYHDFQMRNPDLSSITFEHFVLEYINSTKKSYQPKDHRLPISNGCSPSWIQGGWDYIFQLEQMSLWLPCMLAMLNLTHITQSLDWSGTSLFKITSNMSIEDYLRVALDGGPKELSKSVTTGHESHKTVLHTKSTISVINTVFHTDFVLGGYKLRDE